VNDLAHAVYAAERGVDARSGDSEAGFAAYVRAFDSTRYLRALRRKGFRWLPRADAAFPPLLGAIHDPPAGLFLRGASAPGVLARPAVAIVGARSCSPYGAQVARMLGRELAGAGLVVVSGLARGIDG
jgi:DNA processing protein